MGKAWPSPILLPTQVTFHPDIPSASGGPAFGGREQVVFSSAGRWSAQLTMRVSRRVAGAAGGARDRILAARAMVAYLKGRSNTVYMPVYDEADAPSALAGGPMGEIGGIAHSDGTLFDDSTAYNQLVTPAQLASPAAAGALCAVITLFNSSHMVGAGQYFGLGQSELYLIDSVVDDGNGSFNVTFWPPLRSAHNANEDVNFDRPTCEMRLAADNSGALAFPLGMSTDMQLQLVEAL